MANDYAMIPWSVFHNRRTSRVPSPLRPYLALVSLACNDWGLFDANPKALARLFGMEVADLEPHVKALVDLGIVEIYEVVSDFDGIAHTVGEIPCFLDLPGLPPRVAEKKRRTKSYLPLRDGSYPTHKAMDPTETGQGHYKPEWAQKLAKDRNDRRPSIQRKAKLIKRDVNWQWPSPEHKAVAEALTLRAKRVQRGGVGVMALLAATSSRPDWLQVVASAGQNFDRDPITWIERNLALPDEED